MSHPSLTRDDIEAKFNDAPVAFLPCDKRVNIATLTCTPKRLPLVEVLPIDPLTSQFVLIVLAQQTGVDDEERFEVWGYHRIVPLLLQCKGWPGEEGAISPIFPPVHKKDCADRKELSAVRFHHDLIDVMEERINIEQLEASLSVRFEQYMQPTEACLSLPIQSYIVAAAAVHYCPPHRKANVARRFFKGEDAITRYRLGHTALSSHGHFRVNFDEGGSELLFVCRARPKHARISNGVITCMSVAMRCWFDLTYSRRLHQQAVEVPRTKLIRHPEAKRMIAQFADNLYIGHLRHHAPRGPVAAPVPIPDLEELGKLMPACMQEMSKIAFHPKRGNQALNQPEQRMHYADRLVFNAYVLGNGVPPEQLTEKMVSASLGDQADKHKMASQIQRAHKSLQANYVDFTSCAKFAEQGRCPYVNGGHELREAKASCRSNHTFMSGDGGNLVDDELKTFYSPVHFTQQLKKRIRQAAERHAAKVAAASRPSAAVAAAAAPLVVARPRLQPAYEANVVVERRAVQPAQKDKFIPLAPGRKRKF